jgi:hypothetical protein
MPDDIRSKFGLTNVARIGIFSALAFGVNAPFLVIPSVEIFSLALFLSGIFLGLRDGLAVALVAGTIFVFFNPNGPQTMPLVGLAQLFGFLLFGFFGGLLRFPVLNQSRSKKIIFLLALSGGVLTLWYDFSTNLVFAVIFGPFWGTMIGGMALGVVHIVSNTAIFGLSSLIIYKIWKRIGYLLPPLAG